MPNTLNAPEARREALRARLDRGASLGLGAIAEEYGISVDTVRRDLKMLEAEGHARCIRGGAMPVTRPARPAVDRMAETSVTQEALAAAALPLVEDGMVLMLDGGATVLALAQMLPPLPNGLIVTPAPAVALAALAAGTPVQLVGGRLSPLGAITVGHGAVEEIAGIAADLACLGVCGLDASFGLGADDMDEAQLKRAMIGAAHRSVALTAAEKIGRRARHRVAPCKALDILVTDAASRRTQPFARAGMEIRNV